MFDLASVNKRYFTVNIGKLKLDIEPPKLKVLRKLDQLQKNDENPMEELIDALSLVLNKNKSGYKVSNDFIENNFNTDEMTELLEVYFAWVGTIEKN